MKIIIAAVPGSGKTTILNIIKEKMPQVKIVTEGDLIFEIAKKKFNIKNRDEMRKTLNVEQQRYVQEHAAKEISEMKDKIILLDTHVSIETSEGYFPGLADRTIAIIKPDVIVLLEFNPQDILERRKKDTSRRRDLDSMEKIEEHQKINENFAAAAANYAECPLEIISLKTRQKKPFEHAEIATQKIIDLIKEEDKWKKH